MEDKKNYYNPLNKDSANIGKIAEQSTEGGNYVLRFVLTKLFGARVIECDDEEGNLEKGVFIPLVKNDLRVDKGGNVSVYGFVSKCFTSSRSDYWTHYIKLKASSRFVEKINSMGYKMPYLGNMKSKNYIVYKNNYKKTCEKYKEEEE